MTEAQKHREYVISALSELKSDTEHIKEGLDRNEEQLNQINGRVRKTEEKVKFIEGVGSVLSVIFTFTIGWLFRR
jgi:predicted nuclease with TOPRIM domain